MKTRQVNTIRTDYLESLIAKYTALKDYDKADAIRDLANALRAPISDLKINREVKERIAFYNELK